MREGVTPGLPDCYWPSTAACLHGAAVMLGAGFSGPSVFPGWATTSNTLAPQGAWLVGVSRSGYGGIVGGLWLRTADRGNALPAIGTAFAVAGSSSKKGTMTPALSAAVAMKTEPMNVEAPAAANMKVEPVNATSSSDAANAVSMKSEPQNVTILGTPVLAGANRESRLLPVASFKAPTAAIPDIGSSHTVSSETSTSAIATLGYRVLNVMTSPLGSSATATIQTGAEVDYAPATRQDEAVMTRAAVTPRDHRG
ncbi:hypothetical protein SGGMMB4_00925 [Sodalis glossinidius str. 'morsitans']|uniref:Uncharacterized protein n=1 Tax=Sodalis glossinidius (strain morsitans) TaxID=343509 RepID=Q2NW33_SODGM|nr:hypothetical protein [Sodalis glossinidius]BAE73642.1 hypothetical protein SG0367 [Sodalis glossinidius str. 'morsitans']CRL44047.1 hypothetical protein SGGMMB4_00925 [Sodalis glossinidius str. 'morsitans']